MLLLQVQLGGHTATWGTHVLGSVSAGPARKAHVLLSVMVFNITYEEGWEGKAIKNIEKRGKAGDKQVSYWHLGWGWSVTEHVSRKGRAKGLQREQRLTVYYYRKLNQEATNAVYTILPLITPPLLHWPFGWLHSLRGGDSSTAISSELSCRLLITMLLLLMAFITVSVFYVRFFFSF